MRTVGRRIVREPALRPSADLLRTAATVNDTLKGLLPGGRTCMPKGVYRFRTLDEGNVQQAEWLAQAMAEIYLARRGMSERARPATLEDLKQVLAAAPQAERAECAAGSSGPSGRGGRVRVV